MTVFIPVTPKASRYHDDAAHATECLEKHRYLLPHLLLALLWQAQANLIPLRSFLVQVDTSTA
jgi:hypothetical protein